MSTIQEEYERLVELSKTPEGWAQVETAWSTACSIEEIDNYSVDGFAIDSKTKHCITVKISRGNHAKAYSDMQDWIMENDPSLVDIDELRHRPVKGWSRKILDFESPCIFMENWKLFQGPCIAKELEEAILEQGIGLPLNCLFYQKHLEKKRK